MRTRVAVRGALLLVAMIGVSRCQGSRPVSVVAEDTRARNVILLTVDTLRPDRMSLYGYVQPTTPHVEHWFGNGVFTNARNTAPCTMPAVKQMLTGRLDAAGPTLAVSLSARGLDTAAVVSQHCFTADPLYRTGFAHWDVQSEGDRDRFGLSSRRAAAVTDGALDWIDGDRDGRPFFLWVHYFDPHDPYDPPADARVLSRGVARYPHGDRRSAQLSARTDDEKWFLVDRIFDDADRDALSRLYDDEVRYVDREIGRLLDGLFGRGLLDESALLLAADHGERLGERDGAWDHCWSLDDLELRVPLAVRFAGAPDLVDRDAAVSTLDLYPTIHRVLGIPVPANVDGSPLTEVGSDRYAVAAFDGAFSVADASWKLRFLCGDTGCLPAELLRQAAEGSRPGEPVALPDAPEVVERLTRAAERHRAGIDAALALAEDEFRRLRALGYTQ